MGAVCRCGRASEGAMTGTTWCPRAAAQ
jgi:hypothetical protein